MQSKAKTADQYVASLSPDRRAAIQAVRDVVNASIDAPFEEGMQYGMIGWYLPHSVYPAGYHCDPEQPLPFAGLASQKNYMSLYLFCIYGSADEERWFREQWTKDGRKLDMGKGCVRFKQLGDVPLDVLAALFRRAKAKKFLALYEALRASTGKRPRTAERTGAKSSAQAGAAARVTRASGARKTKTKSARG